MREVVLTKLSESTESLMTDDSIKLSWNDVVGDELPAGVYIVTDNGERYRLLDPYTPEQKSEGEWRYEPKFESRTSAWSRVPLFFYTYDINGNIISREPDWNLTDNAQNFATYIAKAISTETGETWTAIVASDLIGYQTISFQSTDIRSALNLIASSFETEWLADKNTNTLYLGKAMFDNADEVPMLEVGTNIKVPSVTDSKEGYYNRFYVFGSTRNITQEYQGANVNNLVNKRLTLDPAVYPDGYIDIRKSTSEPVSSKILTFDDIYPKSNLIVTEARPRLMYTLKDGTTDKVQIGTDADGNPVYDQYVIWYIQLATKDENGVITPFRLANKETYSDDNPNGVLIAGKALSIHFSSGALNSREFEVDYHDVAKTETTGDGVQFQVKEGDFEIIYIKDNNFIVPAMTGVVPNVNDDAILFNLRMPSEYIAGAYLELKAAAEHEIAELYEADRNNYEFASNKVAFADNDTLLNLRVGQKVIYKNGDYSYETRILSITKKLDHPFEQTIKVGNDRIKGNTETLREDVANANKDINLIAAFNQLTQSTINNYNRAIANMTEGFERINRMWQFDPKHPGVIITDFTAVARGNVVALSKGDEVLAPSYATVEMLGQYATKTELQEALAGLGTGGIDTTELQQYLTEHHYITSSQLPDLSKYALKTEIPSLADYYNKTAVDAMLTTLNSSIASVESALGDKLDTVTFDEMFEWVTVGSQRFIRAKATLVSVGNLVALYKGDDVPSSSVGLDLAALESYLTDNEYVTKDWVLNQGFLTGVTGFLPLTGGTLKNGNSEYPLIIDTNSPTEVGLRFCMSASPKAWFGYHPTWGTNIYNYASNKYLGIKDDGTPHYQGNTLLHAANYDAYAVTLNTLQTINAIKTFSQSIRIEYDLFFKNTARENGIYMYFRHDSDLLQFAHHKNYAWQKSIGSIDINGNMSMTSYIKVGGTSSQFLMADGSVLTNVNADTVDNLHAYDFVRALYNTQTLTNADMNNLLNNQSFIGSVSAETNYPNGGGWYNVIQLAHRNGAGDGTGFVGQIALGMTVNHEQMYFRTHRTRAWQRVLTNNNFSSVLDSRYVNKSGDTMTGKLTIVSAAINDQLEIKRNSPTGNAALIFSNTSEILGYLGIGAKDDSHAHDLYFYSPATELKNRIWHAGNDGAGSGLDADLLDGYHESSFMRMGLGDLATAAGFDAIYRCQTNSIYNYSGPFDEPYGTIVTFNSGTHNFGGQFHLPRIAGSHISYRGKTDVNNTWSAWQKLAFVTDNVASATRLQSSFSLWGQSFYGNDVSGNMTGVGSITASGGIYQSLAASSWAESKNAYSPNMGADNRVVVRLGKSGSSYNAGYVVGDLWTSTFLLRVSI